MSVELLSKVNNRYQVALRVHAESHDLFYYLALPGFAMIHEYQYVIESYTQRRLKKFIIDTCGQIVYDELPKSANILEPLTKEKDRLKVQPSDRWNTVQQAFTVYERWERETLKYYEVTAKELSASGSIAEYSFVVGIVNDVNDELAALVKMVMAYSGMDWDMPQIQAEQDTIYEKYIYKLKEFHKKYPVFHHHNSA